ncbi:acyltransferase family protein [Pseudomonas brenneri]|uniref:acyltransferase family protein n=1 Tax=Pseudomonas brenneri TaxID=129817 RepID=UPI003570C8D9
MTSFSEIAAPVADKHLIHPKYRPDIDGLRAVAVLSVVFFHAFPRWVPGGFIGVDIFFIISGFLISTIIYGSLERQAFSFTEFYGRRIKRIFPALLLVLIACYAFGWFTLFADEYKQLGKHLAGGAGFISNFVLWDEAGYFDTAAEIKPLLHLWSLGIEEQFYIAWPLIMWAAWKIRLNMLAVTVMFLVASFVLNMINIGFDPSATFYMPHTRAWELLSGSVLAYVVIHQSKQGARSFMPNVQSLAGVALLSLGFAFVTSAGFPGWQAIIPCAGAILIISAGPTAWINRNILGNKLLVWVGLISFPLYLWHWPLLTFARIIEGDIPSRNIRIAAVVVAVALAWATYYLVERPLRKNSSRLKAPLLVVMMAAVGGAGYFTYANEGLPDRASVVSAKEFNAQFVGATWKYAKNDICMNKYPFPEANSYQWWFCMASSEKPPTLLLLGNSYANHHFPGLISNPETGGNSVLSIGSCTPEAVPFLPDSAPSDVSPCSGSKQYHQLLFINELIKNNPSIKTVIVDGLAATPNQVYWDRVMTRLEFLEKQGVQAILFTPHLTITKDLKGCYSRPLKTTPSECVVPASARNEIDALFNPMKEAIQKRFPKVLFFDQNAVFCNAKECSLIYEGMPMYRDQFAHYSEFASKVLIAKFAEWAKENAPSALIHK